MDIRSIFEKVRPVDYSDFFVMKEASKPDAVRLDEPRGAVGNRANEVATGAWLPEEPLRFVQYEGKVWYDLVGSQYPALRLFSKRILDAFSAAGVTGWEAAQVVVANKARKPVSSNYALFVVTGRSGPIDNSLSVQTDWLLRGKPTGKKVWKGRFFQDGTWDGSDVFAPSGTAFFFVTSKVKAVLEQEQATNIRLEPISEVIRPVLM